MWAGIVAMFAGRAYGNLGLSYESLGEYEHAIGYQEQHLGIAVRMGDNIAKTLAYSSLGTYAWMWQHRQDTDLQQFGYMSMGQNRKESDSIFFYLVLIIQYHSPINFVIIFLENDTCVFLTLQFAQND